MKTILFILFCLLTNGVSGQQKQPKLEIFIDDCIAKGISHNAYIETPKNYVHFFAIAVSFDKEGKIDSVSYSKKLNPNTQKLFNLNATLITRIRSYHFLFKDYASKTVLMPFYYYNFSDKLMDYNSGFLVSFEDMLPKEVEGKPVIILKPKVNPYVYIIN